MSRTALKHGQTNDVEQWDVFETALKGPAADPVAGVSLTATFRQGNRCYTVDGFYDGDDAWRVRCMPDATGMWEWRTESSAPELDGRSESFRCVPPAAGNHGPVHPTGCHFCYADGTPYLQFGTTCYAWTHQGDELEEQTLRTLETAPFNKIRMCVFPKHYAFNANEPVHHPFEAAPDGGRDFTRPSVAAFRHLEDRVRRLGSLGIEADLILFHPYDRWGYADMGADNDDRYLRTIIARMAAFRNVWWSLANEYDLMKSKSTADWDRFFRMLQSHDPYAHPRSIHNCRGFYDHARPWVTHASIQHSDLHRVTEWRAAYGKPIVVDECCYEGNISQQWGSITAQEMSHRFWEGTLRGGWVGHGETYLDREDVLWWSKGGTLHGESPARIAFLRSVLEEAPPYLEPTDRFHRQYPALCAGEEYFLVYLGIRQPAVLDCALPSHSDFSVEVIDTWQMHVDKLPGTFRGSAKIPLPGRPYVAIRARAAGR